MAKKDGTINITSYNQSGGITAQNVNFSTPPRKMDDFLGNHIKDQIPTSSQITVNAVLGDDEAYSYATQIFNWLKANGYTDVKGVGRAVYNEPVKPLSVYCDVPGEYLMIIGNRE